MVGEAPIGSQNHSYVTVLMVHHAFLWPISPCFPLVICTFFCWGDLFLFLAFLELGQLYLSDPTIPLSEHFKSATLGLRDSKKTSSHQKWVVFEVMGVPQVSEHWMVYGTFLDFLHLFLWMRNMRTRGTPALTTPPFFFPLR